MRSYGRFTTSITRDEDFRQLTAAQQGIYYTIGLQPEITAAGTLPLTYRRWAQQFADQTPDTLHAEMLTLQDRGHFLIDEDTEELLIVKFVKWDGGYTNSKRLPVIAESASGIASPILRRRLASELLKLGLSDVASDALPDALSDVASHGTEDRASDRQSDAITPSDRVVVKKGEYVPQPATPSPQPASLSPVAQRPAQKRGTRLPDDWLPNQSLIDWQRNEGIPDEIARRELPRFRDYWQGKAGRDATKADWPATWRNWLRRAWDENPPPGNPNGKATTKAQGWLDLGRQLSEGRTA